MKLSDLSRLFYLASYLNYNNELKRNDKTLLRRCDFDQLMGLSERETIKFIKELKANNILYTNLDKFLLHDDILYKGFLNQKMQNTVKACIKVNIDEVRYLYTNCIDNRKHKLLGYIFRLIPYLDSNNNIVLQDKNALWYDILNILNYKSNETKLFSNQLMSLQTSKSLPLIMVDNERFILNKDFVSNERSCVDTYFDLDEAQNMINKIRDNNLDENLIIYLINIVGTNYYKIGVTQNINKRMIQLQTSNPMSLSLVHNFIGGYKIEFYLHKLFFNHQVKNEWYELPQDYVDLLTQII